MTDRRLIVPPLLGLCIIASSTAAAFATEPPRAPIPSGVTRVLEGAQPNGFGGGPVRGPEDFMTDEQREEIRKAVDVNIRRLREEGRLVATEAATAAHPLFGWPLRMAPGLTDPGYHGIQNYVDLDPAFPSSLLDFNCGTRTYDRPDGYNHSGTDFLTWPWGWRKMDRNEVQIVAVAAGQIVYRNDGNFDRSCGPNNNPWNAVFVQHADGSTVWYGHMKNGSLTPKQVGDTVLQGEFLGVVGSSGNSTGPHLHLETYDASNHLIEPWAGPCNSLNADSWWTSQRPYDDSAVDRVTTGNAVAVMPVCPTAETPNTQTTFAAGPTVYFTTYYRNQLNTQLSTYTIYRPDGTVYSQWSHSSIPPYFAVSWWWWSFPISAAEPQGTWRFTVEFQSSTYERLFTIGEPAACGSVPESPAQGNVLRLEKVLAQVRLLWGASCNPQDTNYVVYEGSIGNFTSHSRVMCTTSGLLGAQFTPQAGGRYFLVGPRNATREGSLGLASSGAERPQGVLTCAARLALQCP